MKLRKINDNPFTWVEPVDHHLLFKHCAEGVSRVKEKEYEKTVAPLLLIHGIELLQFIE